MYMRMDSGGPPLHEGRQVSVPRMPTLMYRPSFPGISAWLMETVIIWHFSGTQKDNKLHENPDMHRVTWCASSALGRYVSLHLLEVQFSSAGISFMFDTNRFAFWSTPSAGNTSRLITRSKPRVSINNHTLCGAWPLLLEKCSMCALWRPGFPFPLVCAVIICPVLSWLLDSKVPLLCFRTPSISSHDIHSFGCPFYNAANVPRFMAFFV
ncbi:hypothetical protein CC86DRAFT_20424 [Ophiobolus disseminans]|uniref:Uncharacterized protein n=1 Tax=Ophiobolus disseminans TaxID=1469910 RepID=A0A6A7A1Z0_9PLEO|nr:hypothetical protein CC86DRAFT_20424 [Ophiobolus disseminans]